MARQTTLTMLLLSTALATPAGAQAVAAQDDTAAAASAQGPASASPDATPDAIGADDIVVTARRRDERLVDAPVAITALGNETLRNYNITSFADVAQQVPTLITGRAASGSSASIFLRGVGSTALSAGFDQSVSFVIDGLPMSRGRELNLTQYDVQRIEVLKGPQALFFGKNTTSGLISVTTNSPGKEFEAGLRGGYGFRAEEKYVEGYVSGPLSDTIGARLAFRFNDSEGAFTNTASPTSTDALGREQLRNSDKRGFSNTKSGRLTLEWEPSTAFKVQFKGGYTQVKDGGPTDIVERICGAGRTTPASSNGIPASSTADCRVDGRSDTVTVPLAVVNANYRYARNGRLYADLQSGFAILTAQVTSDPFDVTSISSYYRFKQTDLNNVAGQSYPSTFSQLADYDQFTQETRFQSKLDGPVNAMFGTFYSHGSFVFNTDAYIFPIPVDAVTDTATTFKRDDGFSSDSMSVFGELTANLGEQIELSGGARYSLESRDSYQRSLPAARAFAGAFPGNISLSDRYREDNISPQATIRYKPSRDTTLYAAYKQGFKSGGFNISQSLTPAASVRAGRFGSETAEGAEVGLRTIRDDGRLTFNATAYRYTYKDLQVQTFDPISIGQVADNAGKLRTQGVEADLNWSLSEMFSVRAAGAYNDAKYRDYVGQCYPGQTIVQGCNLVRAPSGAFTSQDYGGRTPPKAPKYAARGGATFNLPLSSAMRFQLSGDVSYTSRYNFTDTLRPDGVQRGFTKIDAAARLIGDEDRWTVSVIGRNLTNKLIVTTANDIPFTGGTGTGTATGVVSDMSAFVDNPREIYLELGVKF